MALTQEQQIILETALKRLPAAGYHIQMRTIDFIVFLLSDGSTPSVSAAKYLTVYGTFTEGFVVARIYDQLCVDGNKREAQGLIRRVMLESPAMQIGLEIKTLTGRWLSVPANLLEPQRAVKEKILDETGIPIEEQRINFGGKESCDDGVTLLQVNPMAAGFRGHLIIKIRDRLAVAAAPAASASPEEKILAPIVVERAASSPSATISAVPATTLPAPEFESKILPKKDVGNGWELLGADDKHVLSMISDYQDNYKRMGNVKMTELLDSCRSIIQRHFTKKTVKDLTKGTEMINALYKALLRSPALTFEQSQIEWSTKGNLVFETFNIKTGAVRFFDSADVTALTKAFLVIAAKHNEAVRPSA